MAGPGAEPGPDDGAMRLRLLVRPWGMAGDVGSYAWDANPPNSGTRLHLGQGVMETPWRGRRDDVMRDALLDLGTAGPTSDVWGRHRARLPRSPRT